MATIYHTCILNIIMRAIVVPITIYRFLNIFQKDDESSHDNSSLTENGVHSLSRLDGSDMEEARSDEGKNRPHPPVSEVTKRLKRKLEDENDNQRLGKCSKLSHRNI